jgi:hypothetical protein
MIIGKPLYYGVPLALAGSFSQPLPPISLIYSAVFSLLWSGLLVTFLFSLFNWIAAGASIWLEVAAASRSPRPITILCLTFASGLFAVGFGSLLVPYRVFEIWSITSIEQIVLFLTVTFSFFFLSLSHPFAFLAFSSLWVFPLTAWFWRGRAVATATASWAFLDPSPQALKLPRQALLRPGFALIIGLTAGLAFCVLLLVVRIALVLGLPETVRNTVEFKLTLFFSVVAIAALMQAGVAAIVAGWVRRLGWAHGLLAAFVAGCVMTVGFLGTNLLFGVLAGQSVGGIAGGGLEPKFVWNTFGQIVNWGALLSFLPAVGVSAIAGWMRQPRL